MNWLIAQGRFLLKVLDELMRLSEYDAEVQLQSLNRVPVIAETIYRLAAEAPEMAALDAITMPDRARVRIPAAVRLALEGRK